MIKIRQATAKGYIECVDGGIADLTYPTSKTRRGRVQDSGRISPSITVEGELHRMSKDVYRIRKLTPRECWRLQGFSTVDADGNWNDEVFEKAEKVVSNTQLYKQAGNSITVDTLCHIFSNLFTDKKTETAAEPKEVPMTENKWIVNDNASVDELKVRMGMVKDLCDMRFYFANQSFYDGATNDLRKWMDVIPEIIKVVEAV